MKYFENYCLKELTTLGVGGKAASLYYPESKTELLDCVTRIGRSGKGYYLLGNGSNLLISDTVIQKAVICVSDALNFFSIDKSGIVKTGASVDIRTLIHECANQGLRAPVELLTIPATVGGAVYMNAGRTSFGVDISQSLVEVEVYDGKREFVMSKNECGLAHRRSVFHDRKDLVILTATFRFPPAAIDAILAAKKKSLEQGADKCYRKQKSAGSVFKTYHASLMQRMVGVKWGDATYAPKTPNCILNTGNATYSQVIALVRLAQIFHKVLRKSCSLEWEIWK